MSHRKRRSVGQATFQGPLSDKTLSDLAQKLGEEWKRICIDLGVNHARLYQIQSDHPFSTHDQIATALIEWRDASSGSPTTVLEALVSALKKERLDLADDLQQRMQELTVVSCTADDVIDSTDCCFQTGVPMTEYTRKKLTAATQGLLPGVFSPLHRNTRQTAPCSECEELLESANVDGRELGDPAYFRSACAALQPGLDCAAGIHDCFAGQAAMVKFICANSDEFAALVDCWQKQGPDLINIGYSCSTSNEEPDGDHCSMFESFANCYRRKAELCSAEAGNLVKEAADIYLGVPGCV